MYPVETQGQLAVATAPYLDGIDVEQVVARQSITRGPRFLEPTAYQLARAIRLEARLLF